jgi:7-cyano-7-deazaguanine synthase
MIDRCAVALVSGGLDSTVALALALEESPVNSGLFFDYGQRAVDRELKAAKAICGHYAVGLQRIELPWLARISSSALIEGRGEIPDPGTGDLDQGSLAGAVWIENRNGIFVNIAAAFAASLDCSSVIVGFNAEEASSFPDNSVRFIESLNRSLEDGTRAGVTVVSPTISMSKRDIVMEGLRLGIPWKEIWSCYRGREEMCGTCESCSRLRRATEGTDAFDSLRFGKE